MNAKELERLFLSQDNQKRITKLKSQIEGRFEEIRKMKFQLSQDPSAVQCAEIRQRSVDLSEKYLLLAVDTQKILKEGMLLVKDVYDETCKTKDFTMANEAQAACRFINELGLQTFEVSAEFQRVALRASYIQTVLMTEKTTKQLDTYKLLHET